MKIKNKILLVTLFILLIFSFLNWDRIKEINGVELKAGKEQSESFKPHEVHSGVDSNYDIKLTMKDNGKFHLESSILIKNKSGETWENLIFYLIPNMYTKKSSPQSEHPTILNFKSMTVNGENHDFELKNDTLNIPLKKELNSNDEVLVKISYDFTLPENGYRLTKKGENYYLAQFYPMIATYQNGNWNKEDYRYKGESYHTGFSDFTVKYDIPQKYSFVSTADNETLPGSNKGSFQISKVKEIFIAILDKPNFDINKVGNVEIRVFEMNPTTTNLSKEIKDLATESLMYFQNTIGPYPHKQLDIIVDGIGMEYPGIVTVGSFSDNHPVPKDVLKRMVVHEIAHQWFYGMVSNDPYNDAWLDEGMTELATTLFYLKKTKTEMDYESLSYPLQDLERMPINLPLNKYSPESQSNYIYGKSHEMLWELIKKEGGRRVQAEKFLKSYFETYKYKEVNTQEFVRFSKDYFNLKDETFFDDWLSKDEK